NSSRILITLIFYNQRGATRWLKGGKHFHASRKARWPCNSISMRVQPPPLRCRGDSLSPNSVTGPQGVAAGINGEIWEPHLDRSLSKNLWAAKAKTWLSHRDCNPAEEAHTLEPKGTGYDAGSHSSDQWALSCSESTP